MDEYKLLVEQKYTEKDLIMGQIGAARFTQKILKPKSINYESIHILGKSIYPIVKQKADQLYQKAGWEATDVANGWANLSDMIEDDAEFCAEIYRLLTQL